MELDLNKCFKKRKSKSSCTDRTAAGYISKLPSQWTSAQEDLQPLCQGVEHQQVRAVPLLQPIMRLFLLPSEGACSPLVQTESTSLSLADISKKERDPENTRPPVPHEHAWPAPSQGLCRHPVPPSALPLLHHLCSHLLSAPAPRGQSLSHSFRLQN